jgi:hypothetical protein
MAPSSRSEHCLLRGTGGGDVKFWSELPLSFLDNDSRRVNGEPLSPDGAFAAMPSDILRRKEGRERHHPKENSHSTTEATKIHHRDY